MQPEVLMSEYSAMEELAGNERLYKLILTSILDAIQLNDMSSVFSNELFKANKKNTEALEELGTYVESVLRNSNRIAEHVESSREMVETAASRAVQNADDINETSKALTGLNSMFSSLTQVFSRLRRTIEDISRRIADIEDISELTNLLALNAAIEAARAGAEGKGFSVVAKEVRKLADRSKDNTEVISTILKDLTKTMDESAGIFQDYGSTKDRLNSDVQNVASNIELTKELYSRIQDEILSIQSITTDHIQETGRVTENIHSITRRFENTDASSPYIFSTFNRNSDILNKTQKVLSGAIDECTQKIANIPADTETGAQPLFIGHDITYPPWVHLEGGESSGISVTATAEMASRLDRKPEFIGNQWFKVFPMLLSGEVDMLINVGWPNPVFKDKPVIVSKPYSQFRIRMFVHRDRLPENGEYTTDQLRGLTIAVQNGSFADAEIMKYGASPLYVDNDAFGIIQHIWNNADGIATEERVGEYLSNRFFNGDIVPASPVLATLDVVYMFRRNDTELKNRVDGLITASLESKNRV